MISKYPRNGEETRNKENNLDSYDYPPYDDNNYNNAISDRVYPWEDIGNFGKDHLSTSAEVSEACCNLRHFQFC